MKSAIASNWVKPYTSKLGLSWAVATVASVVSIRPTNASVVRIAGPCFVSLTRIVLDSFRDGLLRVGAFPVADPFSSLVEDPLVVAFANLETGLGRELFPHRRP